MFTIPAASAGGTIAAGRILPVATASGWAGYVVRSGGRAFSAVSGSWVQPRIVCNRPESSVAFWVGIGGAERASRALEQLGTTAGCTEGASPWYSAWYQLFPANPVDIPVAIRPGDLVSVQLSIRATTVDLKLQNRSTGASFATRLKASAVETTSAEWIAEAPAICLTRECASAPLAAFGRAVFVETYARAGASDGPVGAEVWMTQPIRMRSIGGRLSAAPTRLSRRGTSFAVRELAARDE